VGATDWVDRLKVVKSAEEIEPIKACAALQDGCVEHLTNRLQNRVIKPGGEVPVFIKVNGPCGYYTEITKIFAVQVEPPPALEKASPRRSSATI